MRIALVVAALLTAAPAAMLTHAALADAQQSAPASAKLLATAASLESAASKFADTARLQPPKDAPQAHKGEWIELQSWTMGAASRCGALSAKLRASAAAAKTTPQQQAALLHEVTALVSSLRSGIAAKKPKSPTSAKYQVAVKAIADGI
jgi:hypothetical protein